MTLYNSCIIDILLSFKKSPDVDFLKERIPQIQKKNQLEFFFVRIGVACPLRKLSLYACNIFIVAFTSLSWTFPHFSQLQFLSPSSIRFRLVVQVEHVRVEFLSENSVYMEAALTALYFNICLNIPIPESRDIPERVLDRFINFIGFFYLPKNGIKTYLSFIL